MNIRHDLEPQQVLRQMLKKIAEYERHRTRIKKETEESLTSYNLRPQDFSRKPDPSYIDPMIDSWIDRERTYYSMVRVIEMGGALPLKEKRFILVYGDTDDATVKSGTGPFKSVVDAFNWFLNGGR